jgi:hypothetical protein
MTLCNSIILMKLPDNTKIIGIVGVMLVEDVVTALSALVALRAVSAGVLLLGLHREDSSLLALGVLRLGLRQAPLADCARRASPLLPWRTYQRSQRA